MFSTHPKRNFGFRDTFILSSANTLNLENFVVWKRVNMASFHSSHLLVVKEGNSNVIVVLAKVFAIKLYFNIPSSMACLQLEDMFRKNTIEL